MAITKILARKGRLDIGINYILNGDKTKERVLTTHLNCDPGWECRQMLDTKRAVGKEDGVQYYHIIQSFKPGEVTPEQALEIATEFAKEHLPGYETVISVHVDRQHIHAHLIFNSVNADTGEKYHSNARSYYQQIRATSDRLCREHGLSVIMEGSPGKAVSYIEWLRQSKGQPTFRSMLEADLRTAIQDANDLGHFFMLMEHLGYEIGHGNRLGFRLRGQRPAVIPRPAYRPYKKHPKYTGFVALYIHYLYVLGKIGQRQYPARMTTQLRQEVMKSERYREQFDFLRENGIAAQGDMAAFQTRTEDALANLTKQRTILNVRKKKRKKLYDALADVEALAPAKALYEDGLSGMEAEYVRYMEAVAVLEQCGIPRERLAVEKAELYQQLADILTNLTAALENPFAVRWTDHSLMCILICSAAYAAALCYLSANQGKTRDGAEHGSATWGTPKQVNAMFAQKQNKLLTQNVRLGLDTHKHRRPLNVLVIGGSGAGKNRSYVRPNILEANTNYVITDPKSEVLLSTGGYLKSQGYDIQVLNLAESDGYNPFRYIRDEKDAPRLVNNLIQATTPKNSHESDPFWTKSETALLQAIILMLWQEAPEYEQNFSMVMRVLEYADTKEDDDEYVSPLDLLFQAIEREKPDSVAVRQYRVFKLATGKPLFAPEAEQEMEETEHDSEVQ